MRIAGGSYGGISLMQTDGSQMCDLLELETCYPSMSSAEASHARTSATPDYEPELTEREADSGATCTESLANYDRDTSSWRTSQLCFSGEWEEFSETWPKSGMTRSGIAYQLRTLGRRTSESESGSWPTPTVIDATMKASWKKGQKGRHSVQLSHLANDGRIHLGPKNWPTPSVHGNYNRKGASKTSGDGLATRVKMWPTPQARDYFPPHKPEYIAAKKAQGHGMSNLNDSIGGQLNPTWVEWLQGYPLGWTEVD